MVLEKTRIIESAMNEAEKSGMVGMSKIGKLDEAAKKPTRR